MKIIRLEAYLVYGEVTKPYITSWKKEGITEIRSVVLRLFTDNGFDGLGESDPLVGFSSDSPESVMAILKNYLGPAILGMDPRNLVKLHQKMDSVIPDSPFAKAPIDIAAYDLSGKFFTIPVYQLLGGRMRDRVPMIWPIGAGSAVENAREAKAKIEEGFESLHVKIGAGNPREDVSSIREIRRAVGQDICIMVDVNQGWDRTAAFNTIAQLEQFNLSMVEQPVPAWDIDSMARIQRKINTPLSADESLSSTHQAVSLIRHDAARVFSLKAGKFGGLFRTRQIAALAEAVGIPCFINSMIEMGISVAASLHLAASLPNLVAHGHALMSNLRIKEDILAEDSFAYDGQDILVPQDSIGLGVTLDEEKLEARTLERFELNL